MLAKVPAGGDREVGVIGQVPHARDRRNLAVQKIAHEEGWREPNAAQNFSGSNGFRCFHHASEFLATNLDCLPARSRNQ